MGSAGNAGGFVTEFSNAGVAINFNWGNQNAWERDFISVNHRPDGIDHYYVDNTDFTFYTGHANGNGFTFCSSQADGFLAFNDGVRWGNNIDLEWLTIAACGPLQDNYAGLSWWQRWDETFAGLHLLMGYQTGSYDNTIEGKLLAQHALKGTTILDSWVLTAIASQPSSVRWAVMGVFRDDGVSNWNDHFWGVGSVGPDIREPYIGGYWMVSGPS